MSTTIDQQVVQMTFDNSHFEKNVGQTMSTLDKLKAKLHLPGAKKGLEEVSTAAKKVDMKQLSTNVESVSSKFSAMEVIGVTALANITNSAVNAGKQLVKSLSIDQLTAGWSKYEQKTANVQTIMNATGKTVEEVNGYLEKLMWFSDETSYGFTDMTGALSTMVSSGGDIEKLIPMITGVANATAFAGKGAAEFSRVMQFGINQAYSLGYMQVQDWKTLETATVNSKQLMQSLIDAGVELGKIQKGEVTIENFRKSLADKWVDQSVMEKGFGKFSEFSEEVYKLVENGTYETAADAMEALSGKYGEIGEKAFKSAQNAKSFTEAIDATKDAVSSGWMRTFEIIFGNYEKSVKLWTTLTDILWELFASGGEARNAALEKAFSSDRFTKLADTIKTIQAPFEKAAEAVNTVKTALADLDAISDEVILGKWDIGWTRWDALTEAGYNWCEVQNKVNEKMGDAYRYSQEQIDAQNAILAQQGKINTSTEEQAASTIDLNEANAERIAALTKLSDAQLRSMGYSEEQIKALKELKKLSEKLGMPIKELIMNLDEIDGNWLLTESLNNIGQSLLTVIRAIKDAFAEIFNINTDSASNVIFDLIAALHKFSRWLTISDENAKKLKDTFKGVFAALDIVLTIISGPIRIAFKILGQLLSAFNINILDITSVIGKGIVKVRDWVDSILDFTAIFEKIVGPVKNAINTFKEWINTLKGMDPKDLPKAIVKGIVNAFKSVVNAIKSFFSNLGDNISNGFSAIGESAFGKFLGGVWVGIKVALGVFAEFGRLALAKLNQFLSARGFGEISSDAISGFVNGIKNGLGRIGSVMIEFANRVIETVKNILGIHSPSLVFFAIGSFIILGLLGGLKDGMGGIFSFFKYMGSSISDLAKRLVEALFGTGKFVVDDLLGGLPDCLRGAITLLKTLGSKLIELIQALDIGTIITGFLTGSLLTSLSRVSKALLIFAKSIDGIGDVLQGAGKALKGAGKMFRGIGNYFNSKALMNLALGVLVLAGALFLISKIDHDRLWEAVGVVAVLGTILIGFTAALAWLLKTINAGESSLLGAVKLGAVALVLIGMGAAMLMIAGAAKMIANIPEDKLWQAGLGLAALVGAIVIVLNAASKLTSVRLGGTLLGMAVVFLVMVSIAKKLAKMDSGEFEKGVSRLFAFAGIISALVIVCGLASKLSGGQVTKLGGMLFGIAIVMLAMVSVVKQLGKMEWSTLGKGLSGLTLFALLIAGLIFVSAKCMTLGSGQTMGKLTGTLIGIAIVMGVMALVVKALGKTDPAVLMQGMSVLTILTGLIIGIIAVSAIAAKAGGAKVLGSLITMSVAIAILAGLSILLGYIKIERLAVGLTAVGLLTTFMGLLIKSTKGAKNCKASLITMAVIITILGGVLITLSCMDPAKVAVASAALSAVVGMMALLTYAMKAVPKGLNPGPLIAVSVIVGILGGVLITLSCLDPKKAIVAASALSIVLAALSLLVYATGQIKTTKKSGIKPLIALAGIVVVLGGVLVAMSALKTGNSLENAAALSLIMIVMAGLLAVILRIDGRRLGKANKVINALTKMAIPLAAFAIALRLMPNLSGKETSVLCLVGVMAAMTGLLILIAKLGPTIKNAWSPILSLTAMAVPLVAFALALRLLPDLSGKETSVLCLVGVMAAMSGLLILISKFGPSVKNALKSMFVLTAMVIPLAAFCHVLDKMLPDLSGKESSVISLIAVMGAMTGLVAVLTLIGPKAFSALVGVLALTAMAVPLAAFCYVLGTMLPDLSGKESSVITLIAVMAAMTGLVTVLTLIGPSAFSALVGVLALTAMAVPLAAFCAVLNYMLPDLDGKESSIIALMAVMTLMTGLVVVLTLIGPAAFSALVGVLALTAMAVPLLAFCAVLKYMLPDLSGKESSVVALMAIMTLMTGLVVVLTLIGPGAFSALVGVLALTAMAVPLLAFCWVLNELPDLSGLEPSVMCLIALMTAMTLLLVPLTLIGVAGAAALVGIVALGLLAVELCALAPALGKAVNAFITKAFTEKSINAITKVVEAIGGFVTHLQNVVNMDTGSINAFGNLVSSLANLGSSFGTGDVNFDSFNDNLLTIANGLATFCQACSKIDMAQFEIGMRALDALGGLNIPDAGFIARLGGLSNEQVFANGLAALGDGLVSFGISCSGLNTAGLDTGANALKTLVGIQIPEGKWLQQLGGLSDGAIFANGLKELGGGLVNFAMTCSGINMTGLDIGANALKTLVSMSIPEGKWIQQLGGLSDGSIFANGLKDLGAGIKSFSDGCGQINTDAIKTGAEIMPTLVGMKIPEAGFFEKIKVVKSNAQVFGENLYALGEGINSFARGCGQVKPDIIETGVKALDKLGTMTVPDAGFFEKLGLATDESVFGDNLLKLGQGLNSFATGCGQIDMASIDTGIEALSRLAEMQVPDAGFFEKIGFMSDETVFATGVSNLGKGLKNFATECTGIDTATVDMGASALERLTEITIPDASWIQQLGGLSDGAVFANGLTALGQGLKNFATECTGLTADSFTVGAEALPKLVDLKIPDASWFEQIGGLSDETVFAVGLTNLGKGLKNFATECTGISPESITSGCDALETLMGATEKIPDYGLFEKWGWVATEEQTFAKSLGALGAGVKNFYNNCSGVNATVLNVAIDAITVLSSIGNMTLPTESVVKSWDTALTNLGTGVENFVTKMGAINPQTALSACQTVTQAVAALVNIYGDISNLGTIGDSMVKMVDSLKALSGIDSSAIDTFTTDLQALAQFNAQSLVDNCSAVADTMSTIAADMITKFVTGVSDNEKTATDACVSVVESCATSMKNSDADFSGAGKDVVNGFANGITLNKWIATEAAAAMAKAAAQAAKDELDINSPSKVFRAIGDSVPEGFAAGIDRMSGMVKNSAVSMARTSIDSVKGTISKLADAINSDIDTQPTIRPVLDLSDVRSGAGTIGSMLGFGSSIGVTRNLGTISAMMNSRSQNGGNAEIVSAIDNLGKKVSAMEHPSYNINGITYDDGSNITDAVKTIVRTARIERRV